MNSAASRILKARQYAQERDQRIKVHSFEVELHGENDQHLVTYENGEWSCNCEESETHGVCSHIMAMEQILGDTVEAAKLTAPQWMNSAANRVLKARQYAEERDTRIKVHSVEVELHGDHRNHLTSYQNGEWHCDCEEYELRLVCPHIMAMEEILGETVEPAMMATPVVA